LTSAASLFCCTPRLGSWFSGCLGESFFMLFFFERLDL
jgi:hypothetical protein